MDRSALDRMDVSREISSGAAEIKLTHEWERGADFLPSHPLPGLWLCLNRLKMAFSHPESQQRNTGDKNRVILHLRIPWELQLNQNNRGPSARTQALRCLNPIPPSQEELFVLLLQPLPSCFYGHPPSWEWLLGCSWSAWEQQIEPCSLGSGGGADALPSIRRPPGPRWFNVTVALTASSLLWLHSSCLLCDCAWENLLLECH